MTIECPKCKTNNPDESKFCKECAAPLKSSKHVSVTKTLQTPTKGFKKGTAIAGKYNILQKLGEGGMGIVYKAKDTKLGRTVAIKFLSSDLIRDKGAKKRFIQEAKAAAALNHPQICTIYEVDIAEGQTFIAMENIEGQSIRDKLKTGPLAIDEAKDIALQVAEGLKEAHEKGIVHRDIKPANIMLTEKGQVKITDFGLAKLSWGVDLTKTSTIMGTVAYMSPEQAKGEEIDHRTDIWSLGAMLYEMLTGERPFKKSQEHALIYEILNEDPPPVTSLRPDIPSHIEKVVENALSKKLSKRYQNVNELIQDLMQSPVITFPKAEKSIVVLPFENLSPDPEQEYFCNGMTEEIISDLSNIQSLLVISRTSAMMLKGTRKSMKTIGRELDVQYVLEGSVRKAGNDLRITAQLIDATKDAHLWAEKYSGTLDDVFDIQEKVSQSIVDALKLKLGPEEKKEISKKPTRNVQVHECFLRAKHEIYSYTKESLKKGIKTLQNGLELYGENSLLFATLGEAYYLLFDAGYVTDEAVLDKAEEFARKALALEPDSAYGYKLSALLERGRGSLVEACKNIKKAYDAEPNESIIMMHTAAFLGAYAGKSSISNPLFDKLLEIDPLSQINYIFFGFNRYMEGHFDEAIELVSKSYRMAPEFMWNRYWLAKFFAANKQFNKAFELIDEAVNTEGIDKIIKELLQFLKYVLVGEREKALEALSDETKKYTWNDPDFSFIMPGYYAVLGEKDKAFRWMEHAIDRGFINYPFYSTVYPLLENIRGEERFKKLMKRVKHEWENFEV